MLDKTTPIWWHGIEDAIALADLPQFDSVDAVSRGTGWWELDQIFKIYPSQMVVVHGATNHGKSTFLMNLIVKQYADYGVGSFVFMPENQNYLRDRLSMIWGDRQDWDAFAELGLILGNAKRAWDSPKPKDLPWILGKALEVIKEGGPRMVVLDPWNEIEWTRPRDFTITEFTGECLKYIIGFCREHQVTLFLSAHPTKSGVADGRVPGPYDIDGSAHWANKPDNILCVHRGKGQSRATTVYSQKVREIGAGKREGVCVFDVDPDTGVFAPQHGAVSL